MVPSDALKLRMSPRGAGACSFFRVSRVSLVSTACATLATTIATCAAPAALILSAESLGLW